MNQYYIAFGAQSPCMVNINRSGRIPPPANVIHVYQHKYGWEASQPSHEPHLAGQM
jgi:hypothetical protein